MIVKAFTLAFPMREIDDMSLTSADRIKST